MLLMAFASEYRARLKSTLYPFIAFAWRLIALLTLSRLALVMWQWERVQDAEMLVPVLVQGLRFDLLLTGLVCIVPVLLWALLASNRLLLPAWRQVTRIYFPTILLVVLFMELSTPSFVQQFDFRPNILFVEYLGHPREVFATLWGAYRFALIGGVIATAMIGWFSIRQFSRMAEHATATGITPALIALPFLLIFCFAAVRSTFDHRPINPSTVALSTDALANDLALNSTYTVLYAIYETSEDTHGGFRYSHMNKTEMVSQVRAAMDVDEVDFTDLSLPTLHWQAAPNPGAARKNLVIIIEESLGAEFVGSLGGLELTPNLDALSREGIWFSNLYATGTRSVRGLEALITGFTPTPARSVVKLPKSQRGFFTLAELLGKQGYATSFVYGGEAQFDNMRRFFMNNGFDWVIDEGDYDDPIFSGSWGVSDEDLFNRAHAEFSSAGAEPFFSVVFTSSNHTPFEFPDGRIVLHDADKATVNNAVKYADHALGEFIANAKASGYWENTVFLIVADHNSRVYGADLVPVKRFHIPALILGGSIEPAEYANVASQIDLAPTLLSLINVASEHPMIGHNLTARDAEAAVGRAIMQFNGAQAFMEDDQVIVLQKNLPDRQFQYKNGRLTARDELDTQLAQRARAHSIWSSTAYDEALYRLPDDGPVFLSAAH
jgi:phosphoglycerol transferase MdoB-like AlkP superfamily enzyme